MLDADFRDYFSSLDHQWLERFLEHRIADRRVLRLIQKWLAAGVIENGSWTAFEDGVPQGASAGSSTFRVGLHRCGSGIEFPGDEVDHGDVVAVGAITTGSAFGGLDE